MLDSGSINSPVKGVQTLPIDNSVLGQRPRVGKSLDTLFCEPEVDSLFFDVNDAFLKWQAWWRSVPAETPLDYTIA